jgi:hypothetical protein
MKKSQQVIWFIAASGLLFSCGNTTNPTSSSSQATSQVASEATSQASSSNSSLVVSSSSAPAAVDLYVSPNGNGTDGAGTRENPYTLQYAIQLLQPGHTIYLMAGTYKYSSPVKIDQTTDLYPASSESEMKTLMPAITDGIEDKVIFDFSGMSFYSSNRGLSFNTQYWHAKDFELFGAGDNGVYIGGKHNIIENLNIHDCQDSGLQLGRWSSTQNTIDLWPSYNTIKNCTSHDNHDPTGEDADGFACKLTTGIGNIFDGCISYNNVDDGWDLYAKSESGPIGAVTIKNCLAFNNGLTSYGIGTANSDGNGFKLGGEVIAVSHKIINCIAFNNSAHGFTDNSNPGTLYFENCTAFNNGTRDFDCCNFNTCRDTANSFNVYKNILSFCTGTRTSPITGETTIANSKDEFQGTAGHSVFYYGLSMVQFDDNQYCSYADPNTRGSLLSTSDSPFVTIAMNYSILQQQAAKNIAASTHPDVHTAARATDGSIKLGDFLKVNPASVFATMGENGVSLGADLSGGSK